MAYKTKAPLFAAWQKNKGANISVCIERLDWQIPEERTTAIVSLTQKTQDYYQQKITENPYSWLWLHDRWKTVSQ